MGRNWGMAGLEHQAGGLLLPPECDGELWSVSEQGCDNVRLVLENEPSGLVRTTGAGSARLPWSRLKSRQF